jgi:chromate transport protein ChrA
MGLLMIPILLMAWGDLRDLITPLGYWVAWGLWACAAVAVSNHDWSVRLAPGFMRWMGAAFGLLILGMLLSGGVSGDLATFYQALKIAVIGLMLAAMWGLASRTSDDALMRALYVALVLAVLAFFLSRAFFGTAYDIGTRQGDAFAGAGVLWKSGVFFLPVFLADGLGEPSRWRQAACAVGACLFLAVVDGSRTGLLLIVAVFVALAVVVWIRRDGRLMGRRPWMLPLAALVLFLLLMLNTGLGVLQRGHAAWPAANASRSSRVEALMDSAMSPVLDNRLGRGDQPRIRLLRNGLAKSRECFPLGCGFGSTAIDAGYGFPQNVHNAYLAALADFGLLGFLGMLGFIAASALPLRVVTDRAVPVQQAYFRVGMAGSALAYCGALMLNTFTSEMSEWGYLILMLVFAWRAEREP